ncbi:uncharacterized protein V1516DRAFT_679731 [Lipomyces oligophaga]|uniref:uncharacterized protein n=1 Tax=Lipomyces oligophaga TaxID=45792 RepID=UPI0034CF868E
MSDSTSSSEILKPSKVTFFKKKQFAKQISNARKRTKLANDSDDQNSDNDEFSESDSNDKTAQATMKSNRKRTRGGISETILSSSNGTLKSGLDGSISNTEIGTVDHATTGSTKTSNTTDVTKTSALYDNDSKVSTKNTEKKLPSVNSSSEGLYSGSSNYRKFVQPRADAPTKKIGPLRASSNIRSTTVTDYQPDVCKDYKQTGFCGYGDSCKFVHMRENYKAGWQLDKEWEEVQRKKSRA